MAKAIVIPADPSQPIQYDVEILPDDSGSALTRLQGLVGGFIESVPVPTINVGNGSIPDRDADRTTTYINEEGKFENPVRVNLRATDFFIPGVGIQFRDYIAGDLVILGFDPETGEHTDEIPTTVIDRVKLIDSEAGLRPAEATS